MNISYRHLLCAIFLTAVLACPVSAQDNTAKELNVKRLSEKAVEVVSSKEGAQRLSVKSTNWSDSMSIIFHPIGIVRSPFQKREGTPLQPVYSGGTRAKVVVFPPYVAALKDLESFLTFGFLLF